MWAGTVIAGQTVSFGRFDHLIPDGTEFLSLFLTPISSYHISMSYCENEIYAYSETFSGSIEYKALMLVLKE